MVAPRPSPASAPVAAAAAPAALATAVPVAAAAPAAAPAALVAAAVGALPGLAASPWVLGIGGPRVRLRGLASIADWCWLWTKLGSRGAGGR